MAARRAGFAIACLFLHLTGGAALGLAPDWHGFHWGRPADGEELWNRGAGCPSAASDFDQPPSTVRVLAGRWESDRQFFKDFLGKNKFFHHGSAPPSVWEGATADLPSANKVIYFVSADGALTNCTRCLDCRLSKESRIRAKSLTKDNPDIAQAELVIASPMSRAIDSAMDAFPGKPLILDARLIELAGVIVKGKGQNVIEDRKAGSLLPEYMNLWVGPFNERNARTKMHTAQMLMSPPAGSGNASVERLAVLRHQIQRVNASDKGAWVAERERLREQLDAEELPDARFAAVIRDLRQRPEQRIVVVSHRNLLHIGLGEKLGEGRVTRRVL